MWLNCKYLLTVQRSISTVRYAYFNFIEKDEQKKNKKKEWDFRDLKNRLKFSEKIWN